MLILTLVLAASARADYALTIENWVQPKIEKVKTDPAFLERYRKFCQSPDFDLSAAWKKFGSQYSVEKVVVSAKIVESKLGSALDLIKKKLPTKSDVELKVVILVGCGKTDATALVAPGKTFVFYDIGKLFEQKREENIPAVFLVHEFLHGIQFSLQPEFAPMNYQTPKDELMKFMIQEGAASYFAQKITGASDTDTHWVGILNQESFKRWMEFNVSSRPTFGKRIRTYLSNPKDELHLLKDLFYVLEFKDLEKKRAGYYYGAEIVRQFDQRHGKGLNFKYSEIEPFIMEYFGI